MRAGPEDVRFELLRPDTLGPYVAQLRHIEQALRYPIADGADHFFIDHGPAYHPFFSSLGEAYFLLALRGEEVLGAVTGVVRRVVRGTRALDALYLCDLKVAAHARGTGLARRMLLHGVGYLLRTPALRRVRLLYGAAMRGARGDVMRTARGWNPLRLGRPVGRLALSFVPPQRLAALEVTDAPPFPSGDGLRLGPSPARPLQGAGWCSTAGAKDLRLLSTGRPWPLVHLVGPSGAWGGRWGAYLRACGEELAAQRPDALVCFGADERLGAHLGWLARAGITPEATCTVYALDLTSPWRPPAWVHLPSSEI